MAAAVTAMVGAVVVGVAAAAAECQQARPEAAMVAEVENAVAIVVVVVAGRMD